MKRDIYKALIAFLLIIINITIFIFPVSAEVNIPESKYKYKETIVSKFFTPKDIEEFQLNINYYEMYEYYASRTTEKISPDYILIYFTSGILSEGSHYDIFGDYYLETNNGEVPFEFGYGIYIPTTEEVYSLSEAYALQIEGIESVFTEAGIGNLIGDMDEDRILSIKDATIIQKGLANLIEYNNGPANFIWAETLPFKYWADFNRDCELNIKDATAIQKHLVGLEYR